jgi:hypothetical protein
MGGALSVCGGSILFVVSQSPILVIPHHSSSSFPRHLPVVSRSSPHRYPLLSLHRSSSLSPCSPIILPPHRPSSSATTTREPRNECWVVRRRPLGVSVMFPLGFQRATAHGRVGPRSSGICNYSTSSLESKKKGIS